MTHHIPLSQPSAGQARKARDSAGLTQAQAAELVGLGRNLRWSEYERGARICDPARWMLFLLLTDQHAEYRLTKKVSK